MKCDCFKITKTVRLSRDYFIGNRTGHFISRGESKSVFYLNAFSFSQQVVDFGILQKHNRLSVFDFAAVYHIISLVEIQFQHLDMFLFIL